MSDPKEPPTDEPDSASSQSGMPPFAPVLDMITDMELGLDWIIDDETGKPRRVETNR